jgi:hypothetical protein
MRHSLIYRERYVQPLSSIQMVLSTKVYTDTLYSTFSFSPSTPAPIPFAVLPYPFRQDVSNQNDIREMVKIGKDLETCLAWFSDKSNVTSMTSRNNRV